MPTELDPALTRHLADLDAMVAAFEDGSLPWAEWRHAQHLLVALVYLLREAPEAATDRLRAAIPRYNLAHGVETTPERGYHETLTTFWAWAVGAYLETADRSLPTPVLAERMLAALGDKHLPLRY
jgi:hypothetical protein